MAEQHGEGEEKEHGDSHSLEYKLVPFDYLASATGAVTGGLGAYTLYETVGLAALTAGTALSGGVGALLFAGASALGLGYLGLKAGEYVSKATAKKPKKEDHKESHGEPNDAKKQAIMQQIAAAQGRGH